MKTFKTWLVEVAVGAPGGYPEVYKLIAAARDPESMNVAIDSVEDTGFQPELVLRVFHQVANMLTDFTNALEIDSEQSRLLRLHSLVNDLFDTGFDDPLSLSRLVAIAPSHLRKILAILDSNGPYTTANGWRLLRPSASGYMFESWAKRWRDIVNRPEAKNRYEIIKLVISRLSRSVTGLK